MLSIARALGEAAPLILIGAITGLLPRTGLTENFTALPILIFNWAGRPDSPGAEIGWSNAAAAAGLVLLVAGAVLQRRRHPAAQPLREAACRHVTPTTTEGLTTVTDQTATRHATTPRITTMTEAAPIDLSDAGRRSSGGARTHEQIVFDVDDLSVLYGDFRAVQDVTIDVHQHEITAFIGPSGCGKTTVLRCFNRMNDFIDTAKVEGTINYHGVNLYDSGVNATEVRRRIGMVFQKPNPFPKSIYDNVAYGPRLAGVKKKGELDVDRRALAARRRAVGRGQGPPEGTPGSGLSGGQQQRLCIARAIAVEPEVILMDEPCSALDPIATARIEELMQEIKTKYTIVIVTHNMQQAARVSDRTAFFTTEVNPESDRRTGRLVEYNPTTKIFSNPDDERTEQYVTGRFG